MTKPRTIIAECEECGVVVSYDASLVSFRTYANGKEALAWNDAISGGIGHAVMCDRHPKRRFAMRRPKQTAHIGAKM